VIGPRLAQVSLRSRRITPREVVRAHVLDPGSGPCRRSSRKKWDGLGDQDVGGHVRSGMFRATRRTMPGATRSGSGREAGPARAAPVRPPEGSNGPGPRLREAKKRKKKKTDVCGKIKTRSEGGGRKSTVVPGVVIARQRAGTTKRLVALIHHPPVARPSMLSKRAARAAARFEIDHRTVSRYGTPPSRAGRACRSSATPGRRSIPGPGPP